MGLPSLLYLISLHVYAVLSKDYSGCPPSFTRYGTTSTCVGVTTTETTQDLALQACEDLIDNFPGDVSLIIARNETFNTWLTDPSLNFGGVEYWMGLDDIATELDFIWSDGVKAGWHKWKFDHPKDSEVNDKLCVKMKDTLWEDKRCVDKLQPYCQYELANDSDSCPTDYKLMPNSISCYQWSSVQNPFAEARQDCKSKTASHGGYSDIASVHNKTVWDFLIATFTSEGWIGLMDENAFEYKWLNGETLDWPKWMLKMIPNQHENEDCFFWKDGTWNDVSCTNSKKAFCQYTIPTGNPFYKVDGIFQSTCQSPSNLTKYPKKKDMTDNDMSTCDDIGEMSTVIQSTDVNIRQPRVVVIGNTSCSPKLGVSVILQPICPFDVPCDAQQCIPGLPEKIVVSGKEMYSCMYSCEHMWHLRIGEIIIHMLYPTKICEVYLTL